MLGRGACPTVLFACSLGESHLALADSLQCTWSGVEGGRGLGGVVVLHGRTLVLPRVLSSTPHLTLCPLRLLQPEPSSSQLLPGQLAPCIL